MKSIKKIIVVELKKFQTVLPRPVILFLCALSLLFWNEQLLAMNSTQTSMQGYINTSCGQSESNAYTAVACSGLSDSEIEEISPEQTGAPKTNANRTNSANQPVMSRMTFLRSQPVTTKVSNQKNFDDLSKMAGLSLINKGAASSDDFSKFGLWANGIFRFGNVDSTIQESKGYDYNNLGVTIGFDYAITQDFILGTAFTYLSTSGDYVNNGGDLGADLFNGSIYASYNITDDFYVDAMAFYGGNNYNITRNVNYTGVNAKLEGTPGGRQYGFNLTSGYGFNFQRLVVEPYVSVGYLGTDIDAYEEKEIGSTEGWTARYDAQSLTSLKTTLGALFAYNFDVPWGVLIPQVRGEWHHEFEDHGRAITTRFTGVTDQNETYTIITENPDRDYFTFGTSVTTTLDYGITAFLAYDMLIGYNNISSYGFTLGGRVDF